MSENHAAVRSASREKSNAWTDLALTLPIFIVYHLGVVSLSMRNAADVVTVQLVRLAESHILIYWGLTLGIGAALVTVFGILGRGQIFEFRRFILILAEAVLYAILMRSAAAYAVGAIPLAAAVGAPNTTWAGVVMSLGAGFYEEIAFRVGLFGVGALGIRLFLGGILKLIAMLIWALVAAVLFSAWHYVGAFGDSWDIHSFVFRLVCGLVFTAIYVFRGFAPAVWTHALYDIWVLSLS